MSDAGTDDTDLLLSCDPGGGLQNLLGTRANKDGKPEKMNRRSLRFRQKLGEVGDNTKLEETRKEKEKSLDVSDFFNSEGELVLSGLSQFCEANDSDENQTEDLEKQHYSCVPEDADGEDSDSSDSDDSDGGWTFTQGPSTKDTGKREESEGNQVEQGSGDTEKISNLTPVKAHSSRSRRSRNVSAVEADDVPEEVQRELRRQLVQANRKNPAVQNWLEGGDSPPLSYGVLNLDLNDLKSFAEGISRHNLFPSDKVNHFVPTTNSNGEQIFTRAPNFRTPGGYKPPKVEKKCRDLTEEQIREEVRQMYAFPDADDDKEEEGGNLSNSKTDENKENKSATTDKSDKDSPVKNVRFGDSEEVVKSPEEQNSKIKFDFLHGTPAPYEFGKGKSGKSVKRKLLPNSGGICGGTVGSIPDLGFGIRQQSCEDNKDVKDIEPPIVRTTAWTVGSERSDVNPVPSVTSKEKSSSGFSFGYGEEEKLLSPIKPPTLADLAYQVNLNLLHSERVQPSPRKPENLVKGMNLNFESVESYAPNKGLETKIAEGHTCSSSSSTSNQVPKSKSITSKRRLIKKAATKYRGMQSTRSPRRAEDSTSSEADGPIPIESIASDLEKILNEIELPAEELESLINNLDENDMDQGTAKFFEGVEMEGNFADALAQLKLDSLNLNNEDSFTEKYHAEKFKREQCEKELRSLQENLLIEKQQNAVLEGNLKRRNLMLVQISMTFNRVCEEWKKFDSVNKTAVTKLQQDQKVLTAACKHSKDRITQYEKELHKTLELADSFKSKLVEVQKERDDSVSVLKDANNELEEKIGKLKEEMESLKNERDATLRALRESQIRLDEGSQSLRKMEVQFKALEEKDNESTLKFEELQLAKSQLDSSYSELVSQRKELEMLVMSLKNELSAEKSSKDQLKREMQEETKRTTRAEAERLHDYYNKKVQEILKSATEEASKAESVLKEQMKRASLESERRLAECKERFHREMETLKSRYETEIEKLKRENFHRQLLISSTVKQLQMGDSPNIDVNALSMSSRTPYQKESFDNFAGIHEGNGNVYKPHSFSQVAKFTLDHFPTASSSSKHSKTTEEGTKQNGGFGDIPFEVGSPVERFKTSTPNDPLVTPPLYTEELAGSAFKLLGINYENKHKVRIDKAPSSNQGSASDCKTLFSHLLEAPVRPEKEQRLMSSLDLNGKPSDTPLDPALQKCIQELIKSYTEKLHSIPDGKSVSSSTVFGHKSNGSTQGNARNGNDDTSNNNSEIERIQGNRTSGLDSLTGNSLESRKSNENMEDANKTQPNTQLKPPWK